MKWKHIKEQFTRDFQAGKENLTIKAVVLSNVLSPTKHEIGSTIEILAPCEGNGNYFWTKSGALVHSREIKFSFEEK